MTLQITEVNIKNNILSVRALTDIGEIRGIWKGKNPPETGKIYHCEFDIHTELVTFAKSDDITVSVSGDTIRFSGNIDEKDEDIYYFRFGTDWLEMIEITPSDDDLKKNDYAEFSADYKNIKIYPYDIPENFFEVIL